MKLVGSLIFILFVLAGIIGYAMNIYKITQCDFESPFKCEAVRAVGLIPPVGAIVGWIDLGK